MEIEVYWNDLSEKVQDELISAGYDDVNVTSGVFPVTTIFVDTEEELENFKEELK